MFLPSELGEEGSGKAGKFRGSRRILVCSIYICVQNSTVSLHLCIKNRSGYQPASLQHVGAKRQTRGADKSFLYTLRLKVCGAVP